MGTLFGKKKLLDEEPKIYLTPFGKFCVFYDLKPEEEESYQKFLEFQKTCPPVEKYIISKDRYVSKQINV